MIKENPTVLLVVGPAHGGSTITNMIIGQLIVVAELYTSRNLLPQALFSKILRAYKGGVMQFQSFTKSMDLGLLTANEVRDFLIFWLKRKKSQLLCKIKPLIA